MGDTNAANRSRREFLKAGGVMALGAAVAPWSPRLHAGGSNEIKVGLIGCGGRGTGAARNCVASSRGVRIVAMGDLFADRLASSKRNLASLGDAFAVTPDREFVGFDAYAKVMETDVDLVILATPPGFRPLMVEAAIAKGKHVFMEKPVAVDPVGVRRVIAASEEAAEKGLAIVAGTQRRHEQNYLEVMQRIHDGAIGELVGGQCYWNQGFLWVHARKPEYSDMEWQIRNWLYFTWASGDHICEQHIHNIDVMNWAFGGPPVRALGMGGRQVRTDPACGHIFDHFAIEYEYPNGAIVQSMCRQIGGTKGRVGERLVGTRGKADPGRWIKGPEVFRFRGKRPDPYVQEHADLIASIRAGEPLNEGRRVAESTLTAIMGRMSAYTGKEITWEFALESSQLDLSPSRYEFGPLPTPKVAMPGKTPLV